MTTVKVCACAGVGRCPPIIKKVFKLDVGDVDSLSEQTWVIDLCVNHWAKWKYCTVTKSGELEASKALSNRVAFLENVARVGRKNVDATKARCALEWSPRNDAEAAPRAAPQAGKRKRQQEAPARAQCARQLQAREIPNGFPERGNPKRNLMTHAGFHVDGAWWT